MTGEEVEPELTTSGDWDITVRMPGTSTLRQREKLFNALAAGVRLAHRAGIEATISAAPAPRATEYQARVFHRGDPEPFDCSAVLDRNDVRWEPTGQDPKRWHNPGGHDADHSWDYLAANLHPLAELIW